MHTKALSLKNLVARSLPLLWLALVPALGNPPLKAQSLEIVSPSQIAQASEMAKNQILEKKAASAIALLSQQKYAQVRELLHPDLASQLSVQQIEAIWQNLLKVTGPLEKQVKSRVIDTVDADLVVIEAQFEKTKGDFIVTFNQDGQIVGVDFPKVETIDEIAQVFVSAVAENNFPVARGYLHPFLKNEIFPKQVAEKWQNLLKKTGAFQKIVNTQVRPGSTVDQVDVVFVTIEFEKVTNDMLIIFDNDRRIVGIDFPETE